MKKNFLLLALIFIPILSFAQWPVIKNFQQEVILGGQWVQGQTLAVCGSVGVSVSNDGGNTWSASSQFLTPSEGGSMENLWFSSANFYDVHFLDQQRGFAAGWTLVNSVEIIIGTTDGGATWKVVYTGQTHPTDPIGITELQFTSSLVGYAGSFQGRVIKTLDGGKTWTVLTTGISGDVKDIHFINDNLGFAISGSKLYNTTNGGQTWNAKSIPGTADALWFTSALNGFVAIEGDKMLKTLDGGVTWSEHSMKMSVQKIFFTDSQTGYSAGGSIYKTNDGGQTWALQQASADLVTGLQFYNSTSGIATTFYGSVYATTNGGGNTTPLITLSGFSPAIGLPGNTITIQGENLQYVHTVVIGGKSAVFQFDQGKIYATVPTGIVDNQPISVSSHTTTVTSAPVFTLIKNPFLNSFTPLYGADGSAITLTGNNFSYTTSVLFNKISASFTVINNTTLIANVPAGNATGNIEVVTTYGTAKSVSTFTKYETPVITSISPLTNYREGTITLRGRNFYLGNTVKLNGVTVSAWVKSDTEAIIWGLPANATSGKFSLQNIAAIGYSDQDFTIIEGTPTPTINSISPASGRIDQLITLTGTNMLSIKTVQLNSTVLTFEILSDNELIAEIPYGSTTGPIKVIRINGTNAVNNAPDFIVLPGVAVPEIIAVTPPSGTIQQKVVMEGKNFAALGDVHFNGQLATKTRDGLTKVIAEVPSFATTGPISVNGVATNKIFTVINNYCIPQRMPSVDFYLSWLAVGNVLYENDNLNDCVSYKDQTASVVKASAGSTLTLYANPLLCGYTLRSGTEKYYAIYVDWNNDQDFTDAQEMIYQSTRFSYSDTHYQTFTIPANSVAGTYRMRVYTGLYFSTNPCDFINGNGISIDMTLNVDQTAITPPTFTSLLPAVATYGTTVSVKGAGLNTPRMVTVDGIKTSFAFNSTTNALNIVIPENSTSGEVIINTETGSVRIKDQLTVIPTPRFLEITPALDTVGAKVTIKLFAVASVNSIQHVYINGTEAPFLLQYGNIIATVPLGATSGKISVQNQFGTYESASVFTVIPDPSIDYIFPLTGKMGESIAITGSGFTAITKVYFNGKPATFTTLSSSQISALVPYGGSHGIISVENKKAVAKGTQTFTVLPEDGTATFREIPSFNPDQINVNGSVGHFDFDNDGDQDIVRGGILDPQSIYYQITIYRNEGNGTFQPTGIRIAPASSYDYLFADVNADGYDDIIVGVGGGYNIYYNDANHLFNTPPSVIPMLPLDRTKWWNYEMPSLFKVMDFDHDGDADIIITGTSLAWLEQNNGVFTLRYIPLAEPYVPLPPPYLFEDLDRDGDIDIVVQGKVYTNTNDTYSVSSQILSADTHALIDFNGDGYPDILSSANTYYGNNIALNKNRNGTSFERTSFGDQTLRPKLIGWGDFYNTGVTGLMTVSWHPGDPEFSFKKFKLPYFNIPVSGQGILKETTYVNNHTTYPESNNNDSFLETLYFDFENDGDIDVFVLHGSNQKWPRLIKNYTREKTGVANRPPSAPSLLTIEKISDIEVRLQWNQGTDDLTPIPSLNYNVRVFNETTGKLVMAPATLGTPYGNAGMLTQYVLKKLNLAHTYSFQVQSIDQGYAASEFSSKKNFKLETTPVPLELAAPSELSATATGTRSIKLQWKDNSVSEGGFIIEYKKESDAGYSILANVAANTTLFTDTLSGCHAIYSFRIKAFSALVVSSYTAAISVTTQQVALPLISGADSFCKNESTSLTASSGYHNYLWNTGSTSPTIDITSAGTYTVTVKDAQGCERSNEKQITVTQLPSPIIEMQNEKLIASGGTSYEWYRDDVIQPSNGSIFIPQQSGSYKVKATIDGCSAFSPVIGYIITGLENKLKDDPIIISPNPSSGIFVVSTNGKEGNLYILNSQGKKIYTTTCSALDKEVRVDLSSESPGLYLTVVVQANGDKQGYRFILFK